MAVTIERRRCPPAPPEEIATALNVESIDTNPDLLVRLHWRAASPLGFRISARKNRFDPLDRPFETTRVLYGGTTLEVAIAETVLRWHDQVAPGARIELSNDAQLRDRQVTYFLAKRPLTLIDATGVGLSDIQLAVDQTIARPEHQAEWSARPRPRAEDIFLCSSNDYPVTRAWGAWFRRQRPEADGLQWVPRQFNRGVAFVLFEDRCGGVLGQYGASEDLLEPGSMQEKALDKLLRGLKWTRS